MASLLAQIQQSQHSRSQNLSPKNTLTKNTPVKDVPVKDSPKKGEQTLAKKLLTPDKSAELPIKKQQTSFPSSNRGSESDHDRAKKSKKKKKRKKREPKGEPTVATDSETEETEEQQEKCQQARKWKVELQELKDYCESRNIFLHNLPDGAAAATWGTWSPTSQNPVQASSSSSSRHGGWSWRNRAKA